MPTSPRLLIPYPTLSNVADGPDLGHDIAVSELDNAVIYRQGTAAARPSNPGFQACLYWATDTLILSYYDGAAWRSIGPSVLGADSVTAAMIQAGAVGSSEIADGSVGSAELAANSVMNVHLQDGIVTALEIAAALKPSGGAGGSTEALRAIGSGAGEVVAGNDSRLTDARTPSASWIPVGVRSASRTSGQTYTLTAPATGTYIVEWGAGALVVGGQGSGGAIANNVTAGIATFSDVGPSGGPVLVPGVALTNGQVITFTATFSGSGTSLTDCWAKLTRTA